MYSIDVIIPTYKPDKSFLELVERLCTQTLPVNRIIVMNTEEKYYEELIYGSKISEKYKEKVQVHHLSKREFDHGGTRHMAVKKSQTDVFVMMTQDAMPVDEHLLENLIAPLEEEGCAVSYARQLPGPDCGMLEQITREFNYPAQSHIQSAEQLAQKGIKTYFCSNVCAAYKRKIYDESGGFIRHTIFNEDMIYAAGAVKSGYHIAYAAKAQVYHSHSYTNGQQFRRNFDLGVSQAQNPQVFAGVSSEKEGKRMVKTAAGRLRKARRWRELLHFYVQCFWKYTGYLMGKHYRRLPRRLVLKCTMSPGYFKGSGCRS
ncbi:MAG: glycosyltransferase family 2 protein [Lachnospiraceae bacterium]|nr:glycosyltransferase family 2 protein [Lachnospiraceae bacterium]